MSVESERVLLRELARRVRENAEQPRNAEWVKLWLDHNALRAPRPMVLCYPEGAWRELMPPSVIQCEDPLHRRCERALRTRLMTQEFIADDQPELPIFNVGWRITRTGYGVEVPEHRADDQGSYVWDAPIKDIDADFDLLEHRQWSVDRAGSQEDFDRAEELLGDLLTVRRRSKPWWTVGLTWEAAKLVGLEQLMMLMYDNPAGLHRLMAWLRDDHMHMIQWCEREGLLTAWNENDYVGSGGLGFTDELPAADGPARLADVWGFAESQETVGISPTMFEEFVLPYQTPMLEKFGLNCYGCCEPVHKRIDAIMAGVPRLRRVSAAPMVDEAALKEKIGDTAVFSRKVNPIHVCNMFDEEVIRKELRKTLSIAGGGPLEVILKDTHTVRDEPWRVRRWVELARDEVARFTGRGD